MDYLKRINNKVKQVFRGNWGSADKWTKRHTNIPFLTRERVHSKKKKRKNKKKYSRMDLYSICPFCKEELEVIEEHANKPYWYRRKKYKKECKHCSAKVIEKSCPCCHQNAWHKDGLFTHQHNTVYDCGFTGRMKYEPPQKNDNRKQ